MNNPNSQSLWKDKKIVISIILLILLSLFLLFNAASMAKKVLYYDIGVNYEFNDFENAFADRDYLYLLDMSKRSDIQKTKTSHSVEEYKAIAYYYEALSYYSLYQKAGREDEANAYRSAMEEYRGSLSGARFLEAADGIDTLFQY